MKIKKNAFTLVEMVFVIVVLGIVAVIGNSIIAKIYESYIYSRSVNELQTKTELALTQISKYLSFRVKNSIIARKPSGKFVSLSDVDGSYKILEWIGYNNEGFEGNGTDPGWSGFVDLDSPETNQTQIKTSGSQLSLAEQNIYALSNGEVNLSDPSQSSDPNSSAAIIFDGLPNDFNVSHYGWYNSGDHDYVFKVKRSGSDVLKFIENKPKTVYEHYKLTWSAYALVPNPLGGSDVNLTMYYNFRPWMDENYTDGNSSVLIEHVTTFKFLQKGDTIRLKLCIKNPKVNDIFCKEKVVF